MSSEGDLFKKFTLESVAQIASTSLKEQKKVRDALREQFPPLEPFWEDILPRKQEIIVVRCHDQVHCVTLMSPQPEVLFFNHHDGLYLPHLRLLHKYPFMLPHFQVDIGGCKHVVAGANVMCQGLTSPGGLIPVPPQGQKMFPVGTPVAVCIEGKKHAVATGFLTMSTLEITSKNKGPCIDNVHHLGDGLWMNYILSASTIGTGAKKEQQ
jgi:PUA domain protein